MVLNITLYNLCSYLIPYTSDKIPVTSKLSCPKLSSYLREFPKYHISTPAFKYSYYLARSILGWSTKKYMHMVFYYRHSLYLKLIYLAISLNISSTLFAIFSFRIFFMYFGIHTK